MRPDTNRVGQTFDQVGAGRTENRSPTRKVGAPANTLSARLGTLLREGADSEGGDRYRRDEWSVLCALVTGMLRARWAPSRALRALLEPNNLGGAMLH